ncbi:hypothetical protein OCO_48060 [Mycobacterium intracellulare MOTT-02]|nr:hypothetical protein OCO_48060 [Mycobacterium intracellulare MOTT-02]ASW98408.1 nitrite extrusion protein [Mycobacterium intracellulare]ASX03390.1 nitrite extrusion protein [Mycobacterium intracellulare subsp. chimaera]PBA18971.1 nitrite extrusion protein [Mycobacterium intracellulare]PBA58436.1 nitrite extrusion protein [Mycobacterium intracellulare subsp. chimaera]
MAAARRDHLGTLAYGRCACVHTDPSLWKQFGVWPATRVGVPHEGACPAVGFRCSHLGRERVNRNRPIWAVS